MGQFEQEASGLFGARWVHAGILGLPRPCFFFLGPKK